MSDPSRGLRLLHSFISRAQLPPQMPFFILKTTNKNNQLYCIACFFFSFFFFSSFFQKIRLCLFRYFPFWEHSGEDTVPSRQVRARARLWPRASSVVLLLFFLSLSLSEDAAVTLWNGLGLRDPRLQWDSGASSSQECGLTACGKPDTGVCDKVLLVCAHCEWIMPFSHAVFSRGQRSAENSNAAGTRVRAAEH